MKTIGLIGGLTWESTTDYYRIINREVNKRLGGKHSASIKLYSFDFEEIDKFNRSWNIMGAATRIIEESIILEKSGADVLLLGANTAHLYAEEVRKKIKIPLIHIAEATGKAMRKSGVNKVVLLGTKYTMEGDFIKGKLESEFGLEVMIPDQAIRTKINDIIFNELTLGKFTDFSKKYFINCINHYENAEGIILGCTELPILIKPEDTTKMLFNTTEIHAIEAVNFALS